MMVRKVVLWRCNCGTRVKVLAEVAEVAEGDSNRPVATQTAVCPTCGDSQTIEADKIITTTEDTSYLSPAPLRCEEKERMSVAQNKAIDLYRRRALELAEAAGMMAHADFQLLYDKVLIARQFLLETRQQLIEHTMKHGC